MNLPTNDTGSSSRAFRFTRRAPATVCLFIAAVWLWWSLALADGLYIVEFLSFKNPMLAASGGAFAVGLALLFRRQKATGLHLTPLFLGAMYLLAEAATYALTSAGALPVRNNILFTDMMSPACSYQLDPRIGFRWVANGDCEVARITNGKIEYARTVRNVNNRGFLSQRDYQREKPDADTFRFAVLGDSFSGGFYLDQPWPDTVTDALGRDADLELYNFALDSHGLLAWEQLYRHEILPHFEFDGLILAVYLDDLTRDMLYIEDKGSHFLTGYVDAPITDAAALSRHLAEHGIRVHKVDADQIELRVADTLGTRNAHGWVWLPPNLYFLTRSLDALLGLVQVPGLRASERETIETFILNEPPLDEGDTVEIHGESHSILLPRAIVTVHGEKNLRRLINLVKEVQDSGKPVIFAAVPDKRGVEYARIQGTCAAQLHLEILARALGAEYFDGYAPFLPFSKEETDALWLPYDSHWDQGGSDHFAAHFAAFLSQRQWAPAHDSAR